MKLDEAEMLLAIANGDAFEAARIVARNTGTNLDISKYRYENGTLSTKHDPEVVVALVDGGFIAWSPATSFITIAPFFKMPNPGTITMRAGRASKKRSK